ERADTPPPSPPPRPGTRGGPAQRRSRCSSRPGRNGPVHPAPGPSGEEGQDLADPVVVGGDDQMIAAGPGDGVGDGRPLRDGGAGEGGPEAPRRGVDDAGPAGLGIDQREDPHARKLQLPGVDDLGHHEVVADAQPAQRRLPTGTAQQIRNDDDDTPPPGQSLHCLEGDGQVGAPLTLPGLGGEQPAEQDEEADPAGGRRDDHHRPPGYDERSDPIGQAGAGYTKAGSNPTATSRFSRVVVPKCWLADTSTTSQSSTSWSATGSRTW